MDNIKTTDVYSGTQQSHEAIYSGTQQSYDLLSRDGQVKIVIKAIGQRSDIEKLIDKILKNL